MSDEHKTTEGEVGNDETALPLVNEDGVDLTLIRWSLALTPLQRLEMLQGHMYLANKMRDAWKLPPR